MLIKDHQDNTLIPLQKNLQRKAAKSLNPIERPPKKNSANIMPPLSMIHHLYSPPSHKIRLEKLKVSPGPRNNALQPIEHNVNSLLDTAGKSFSGYKLPNPKLLGRHNKQDGTTFDEIPRAGSETPLSTHHHEKVSPSYLNRVFSEKQTDAKPKNLPSISGHLYSLSTAEDWSGDNKPSEILKKKLESMISKQKSEKNLKKDKKEIVSVKFLDPIIKDDKIPLITSNGLNLRLANTEDPLKRKIEKNYILVQKITDLRQKDIHPEPRFNGNNSVTRASSVDKKNTLLREPLIGGVNSQKIQALRDTIVRTIKRQESELKNLSKDELNKDMLDPKLKELEVSVIAKAAGTENLNNEEEGEIQNILKGIDKE